MFHVGRTLLAIIFAISLMAATVRAEEKPNRLFEMRIYTTHPGKLDDLHKRFREHTNRLFTKHGMDLIGYWVPTDGDEAKNTVIYILAYPDLASREKSWQSFLDDPEWKAAFAKSHENGPIVMKVESKFMNPTDYSAIK